MYSYQYLCLPVAETNMGPIKTPSLSCLPITESKVVPLKSVSVSKFCWQTDMENLLIEEVKKRKLLWDTSDPLFSKKSVKIAEYSHIANILKERWPAHSSMFSQAETMKKYQKLRTYFIREMKKMKKSKINYVPRWIHFNKLSFLATIQCLEDNNEESSVHMQDSDLDSYSEFEAVDIKLEPEVTVEDSCPSSNMEEITPDIEQNSYKSSMNCHISTCEEQEKLQIEKRDSLCLANHMESLKKKFTSTSMPLNESTEELYGRFIASQLQEIKDPMQRDLARIEIQRILIKYKYKGNNGV